MQALDHKAIESQIEEQSRSFEFHYSEVIAKIADNSSLGVCYGVAYHVNTGATLAVSSISTGSFQSEFIATPAEEAQRVPGIMMGEVSISDFLRETNFFQDPHGHVYRKGPKVFSMLTGDAEREACFLMISARTKGWYLFSEADFENGTLEPFLLPSQQ